jgi:VanZ family protein
MPKPQMTKFVNMKKALTLIAIMALMSFEPTPKAYKLELTAQELQVVYDALGELPAKTSETIRIKIVQQVNQQNTTDKK